MDGTKNHFFQLRYSWWCTMLYVSGVQCSCWQFLKFVLHLLEKEMATHSSVLAWRFPQTEAPGRLQSMGSQRVRHDWATFSVKEVKHARQTAIRFHVCEMSRMYVSCPELEIQTGSLLVVAKGHTGRKTRSDYKQTLLLGWWTCIALAKKFGFGFPYGLTEKSLKQTFSGQVF